MTRPGPKLKQYSDKMLEQIARLIEQDTVGLKAIARLFCTGWQTLYRNMEAYYGAEEWEAVVVEYRERRGFKKGSTAGMLTRFKKGHLRGVAARRWKPLGTVIVKKCKVKKRSDSSKGRPKIRRRRFIKVMDEPYGGGKNWQLYCRYLWEQKHGPIPKGMCVVHLDANLMNDSDENLALMSRVDYLAYLDVKFPHRKQQRCKRIGQANKRRWVARRQMPKLVCWDCIGCSAHFETKPECCPKCNSYSFERVKLERVA